MTTHRPTIGQWLLIATLPITLPLIALWQCVCFIAGLPWLFRAPR